MKANRAAWWRVLVAVSGIAAASGGCADDGAGTGTSADGGGVHLDGGAPGADAAAVDTGVGADDSGAKDSGGGSHDGGADASAPHDAGHDAGADGAAPSDTGTHDSGGGGNDTGHPDAGTADTGAPDTGHVDAGSADAGTSDAGPHDAGTPDAGKPDAGQGGPPDSRLPFTYTRPDVGTPVSAQDLSDVTDLYLELLEKTRWFESVDDRVIGWPEGDPQKRYWYGTWWSGCGISKRGSSVTFVHVDVGADNNGLRTAQVMEAACYAWLFWDKPAHERLLDKLIRGFNSWVMAIERKAGDSPVMLSRAAYLDNITAADHGKTFTIDYSADRPGIDNGATEYVNVPANPYWGNIWIKNKRSKDCLGHMFRGMGQMESCAARLSGDAAAQLASMRDKYGAWGRQVEADGWKIKTLDKNLNVYIPTDDLANFYTVGGVECAGQLMIRLMSHGDNGTLSCGSGIPSLESAAYFNASVIKTGNKEMAHVYHEAAVNQALVAGQDAVALDLVKGLADRLDRTMNYIDQNGKVPDNVNDGMVTTLILHAADTGVPLTSREVRWIHDHIRTAHASYLDPSMLPQYDIFTTLPDGDWPYSPDGQGIAFNNIGLPLGSCASVFRNPAGRPILDCAKVLANPR